ncbi:Catabolite repression HPr [Aedoeadaptatus ivorii]|uniref:Phosphocarrier protein HPr n=1 Tax=Aedoeadaptatus ivorii TaxID=54006 RepID=A0A448V318_9FIRM|nr:HPr family phosphocarrier protein [Peptoniphilus ivorii]MDQ0508688.1 phosphotransferase system HPr (HPr) family protein [Peptoniphilus ivorii]VEJ36185.1 Catabolite repression HPr [Peptoniphilus ivorii]
MKESKVTLQNEEGLHARAAALFVRKANQFASEITILRNGEEVNGKSIIGIMSLGVFSGQEIVLRADGADEDEAVEGLVAFVKEEL